MVGGMRTINQQHLTGERALFHARDLSITDTVFSDGESPLKHCDHIDLDGCLFRWKYPLWYSSHIRMRHSTLFEMARAGIWYTNDITLEDVLVEAPKELRRCDGVVLRDVSFPHAEETLWNCRNVELSHVVAKGDYFGMGCEQVKLDHFTLYGNYCFDGAKNVEASHCRFLSKDCFWNAEHVVISDSFISGEYLAWNAKDVTLVRCTIQSLQGLCYVEHLVMKDCKLIDTTLAFEYSDVQAEITGTVDSVLNPKSGTIKADHIDTLYLEADRVDPAKTTIVVNDGSTPKLVPETEWAARTKAVLA